VRILLTNDDGIYAPGLAAMERELASLGEVTVVAPANEQSGVGHSITYHSPLICQEIFDGDRRRGWAVEGSPADCVKIGIFEYCSSRPDLIVSGINSGLNAGINVLYSGTVAAAIEGAFFGITSVAVSLEFDEHAKFDAAAATSRLIIEQILEFQRGASQLYNLNIPTAATHQRSEIRVVPMGLARYGEHFIRREDPKGRTYFWATTDPPPQATERKTDITELEKGHITLTPLHYDMTSMSAIESMQQWTLRLGDQRIRLPPLHRPAQRD